MMSAWIQLLVSVPLLWSTAQEPVPGARYESVISELYGSEIIYHFENVVVVSEQQVVHADKATVRLDREKYQGVVHGSLLLGDLGTNLFGLPGEPLEDAVILEIRLQGSVKIDTGLSIVECDWLTLSPPSGTATLFQARITVPAERGPNLWPWRMQAKFLQEFPDGTLRARKARLTACHLEDPLYSLALEELTGTPDGKGEYDWLPTTPWLEIGSRRILPMPAFGFNSGEDPSAGFGLRGLRISSGKQLGTAIEIGFASRSKVAGGNLDWRLLPSFSTRRGFPLRTRGVFKNDFMEASWDAFALQDQAEDIHSLRRFVNRDNDLRWRARLDNRFFLTDDWQLDVDFALTSDALVDPEFFRTDWVAEDNALSEIYLRKNTDNTHFSIQTTYRLDDSGFTPLGGYGSRGDPIPQQLDLLPRLRFERFATSVTDFAAGPLGGSDGLSQVNWSWGLDVGRFQLRDLDIEAPSGFADFVPIGTEIRDRAMLWSEVAAPMSLAGLSIRPGMRLEVGAIHDPSTGGGSDQRGSLETFLETSMILERPFADNWLHRVRPMIRLRNRQVFDRPDANWMTFDGVENSRSGQAAELSLRQFWYGKNLARPWLDLNLLAAYYPDSDEAITDGYFPASRDPQPSKNWGPGEMRLAWDPGIEAGILKGVRATTHLRYRFDSDHLEEQFSQVSIAPNPNWRLALVQRHWDHQEIPNLAFRNTSVQARWRVNESFEFNLGRTFQTSGNSTTSSRLGMTYFGRGFAFEFYSSQNDVTGEQRFGLNLLPCFLTQPFYQEALLSPSPGH